MTAAANPRSCITRIRPMPSMTGIFRSVRTTSKLAAARRGGAASPRGAGSAVWPARSRFFASVRAMLTSSSTSRMRARISRPLAGGGVDGDLGVALAGQIDREGRPPVDLARHPDLALVTPEDRVDHGEPEARAL